MWSLTEFWRKISDAVREEECPSAPPLSTVFGVSFFIWTFFFIPRHLINSHCKVIFRQVLREIKHRCHRHCFSLILDGGNRKYISTVRGISTMQAAVCRYCWHTDANSNTSITTLCKHSAASRMPAVIMGMCELDHILFFMFVSEWGSFFAALPQWKWKSVIWVVRFSFAMEMRGQLLTHVVITLHGCQGIPSLFWKEQKTVLTLRARGVEDASTMLHAACFTI